MKPRIAIPDLCSYDPEYSARALPPYLRAIEAFQGEPVVLSLTLKPEEIARVIAGCSAILLPGSKADVDPQKYNAARHEKTTPADPPRDAADELLLQDAYNLRKPVLGICYGLQSLNVWRTGTLLQDIESKVNHSTNRGNQLAHQIVTEEESLLRRVLELGKHGAIPVNSSHHQSAERIGDGLRAVARCPDDRIVEAIEGTQASHEVLAVQWHPERGFNRDRSSQKLFHWLIAAAQRWEKKDR